MVLVPKHWKSRSSPGIIADGLGTNPFTISKKPLPVHTARRLFRLWIPSRRHTYGTAGWSSPVARQAHNLKVVGSNPTPATKTTEPRARQQAEPLFYASQNHARKDSPNKGARPVRMRTQIRRAVVTLGVFGS